MNYIKTEIDGVFIIEPKVFNDSRGYFFEAFKSSDFEKILARFLSFKIMSLCQVVECCVAFIIKGRIFSG